MKMESIAIYLISILGILSIPGVSPSEKFHKIKSLVARDNSVTKTVLRQLSKCKSALTRGDGGEISPQAQGYVAITEESDLKSPALHVAINEGDRPNIKFLIKNKIGLHYVDSEGNGPLHLAILKECEDVALWLLDSGDVNRDFVNKDGKTPAQLAEEKKMVKMSKKLAKPRGGYVPATGYFNLFP